MPDRTPDAEAIFLAALERAAPERAAYAERACSGEPALLLRVRELLEAHAGPRGPLDAPPPGLGVAAGLAPAAERPGAVVGPYELLEQVGEGGMGLVFVAEQQHPVRRKVAVKLIKPGMDTREVVARFEAERQALALMDHPNIARVLDAGTTGDGRPYFVMEVVHGVPITKYCDDNHLTPRERLGLFVPACAAIQHAHQKGIIHRDIKPSNVMVALYDGRPVVKVIDFGVAKATGQRLTERTLVTECGTLVGTLEYASPEQAEASALGVDTRSDVYSLGVLLYELLTGSTPLGHERAKGAAYAEVLRMLREEEPQKPSARLSDSGEALASISAQRKTEPARLARLVRGELDWIVMKALEKDRERRYETASAFAADVRRYLDDEPVLACPPSAWYRCRKLARRNKPALATAALLGVTLLAVTAVSFAFALREAHNAQALAGERGKTLEEQEQKLAEQEGKVGALREAQRRLRESRRESARLALVQGVSLCEQGESGRGLLWLARSLGLAIRAEDRDLERSVRTLMAGWSRDLPRLVMAVPHDSGVERATFGPEGKTFLTWTRSRTLLWDAATGKALGPSLGPMLLAVALSPDGKTVLTSSLDKAARLWDAATGKQVGPALQHGEIVQALAFSPDGKTVLTGSDDKTARLWDAVTGKQVGPPLQHGDMVRVVAFDPDGKRVLTVTLPLDHVKSEIRLWEAATGKPIVPAPQPPGVVTAAAFSPGGKHLVTLGSGPPGGEQGARASVWDAVTARLTATLPTLGVTSMAFGPDGTTVLIGSIWGAQRWHLATGKQAGPFLCRGLVRHVACSPDGQTFLTVDRETSVRLREMATGTPVGPPLQHQVNVGPVAFSPDGKTFLTASSDKVARLWAVPGGKRVQTRRSGWVPAFSPDGKAALMVRPTGAVREARLWDMVADKPLGPPLSYGHSSLSTSAFEDPLALSPDGKTVSLPGADPKTAQLWGATSGKPLGPLLKHQGRVQNAVFRPDGKALLTMEEDGTARLWEVTTGKTLGTVLAVDKDLGPPFYLTFSPDGETVLAQSHAGAICLSRMTTGKWNRSKLGSGAVPLSHGVAFSPDGKALLVGHDEGARLWEVVTGEPLTPLMPHQGVVGSVAFSPDGKHLLTGSTNGTAQLWEAATGRRLGPSPLPHQGAVTAVAFSPDARVVLTVSSAARWEARLWDAATGKPLGNPVPHVSFITRTAVSPDGRTALTAADDGQFCILAVPAPLAGEAERLITWAQVITGMELDDHDAVRILDGETWRQRRQRLQELGGPPPP